MEIEEYIDSKILFEDFWASIDSVNVTGCVKCAVENTGHKNRKGMLCREVCCDRRELFAGIQGNRLRGNGLQCPRCGSQNKKRIVVAQIKGHCTVTSR